MTTPDHAKSDLELAFMRRVIRMNVGDTVELKLSFIPYARASRLAQIQANKNRWTLAIEQSTIGIRMTRWPDVEKKKRTRWDLDLIKPGEHRDIELPPSSWQRLRQNAYQYGQRVGARFSVKRLGLSCMFRVTRLADDAPARDAMPPIELKVERAPKTWPFAALEVGQWFAVPIAEKQSSTQISPLCSHHGKKLGGRRFSVRKGTESVPPLDRVHYIIRVA